MNAQLGGNPSYEWHSILAARGIIEKGLRWSIGNGKKVNIWKDRWLPTPVSFKVCNPRRQGSNVEMVANLLDCENGIWDANKVKDTFLPHKANVVFGIPISPCLPEDSFIWTRTNNGRFMVRSAYGVALQALKEGKQVGDSGDCSDSSKMTNILKSIWKLQCPSKIKHFMWRACKNILPTYHCLARRKVTLMDGCVFCGKNETLGHTL